MRVERLSLVFNLSIVFLMGVVLYQGKVQKDLLDTSDLIYARQQQSEELDQLYRDLLNLETGSRGFILTNDPRFLAPYTKALNTLDKQLETVKQVFKDERDEEDAIKELETLIRLRVKHASSQLLLKKDSPQLLVSLNKGKDVMDKIRLLIDEIDKREINKRALSLLNNRQHSRLMVIATITSSALILLFFLVASWKLRSEIENRTQVQQELKINLSYIKTLTGSLPQGVIAVDNDARVVFTNQRASELLNYNPDRVGGEDFTLLASWDRTFALTLKEIIKSGDSFEHEVAMGSGTGRFPAKLRLVPLYQRSELVGSVITFSDITQEHDIREELISQREAAELASKTKTEFLSQMSHEFRTPLNAIIGMSELLEQTPLNEEQRQFAKILHNAAENLLRLINDVLDISKIEAGKIEIESRVFDLRKELEDSVRLISFKASEKGLPVVLDYQLNTDRYLGDPHRLRQIVSNLLSNAVKFTDEGEIRVLAQRHYDHLELRVIDTGRGIAGENLQRIFEKYEQENSGISSTYGGTGLGLAIARELARRMGGELTATSELARGSTFLLRLPLQEAEASETSGQEQLGPLAPMRLLVVDDNSDNRLVVASYLKGTAVTVTEAIDGFDAVVKAREQEFDLIFMDMHMPHMDGLEATRKIKAMGVNTPVVALTAYALADEAEKMYAAGCVERLVKPITRKRLLAFLAEFQAGAVHTRGENDASIDAEILALVPGYLARRREEIGPLREALAQRDETRLRSLAHNLKGTALSYGQKDLDRWAHDVSAALKIHDWEQLQLLAERYEQILTKPEKS